MAAGQDRGASVRYLHSTMVLFKLKTTCTFWEELKAFTFHYGPIQIDCINQCNTNVTLFTFHYGPIQIFVNKNLPFSFSIYIPLWSYSNYERLKRNRKTGCNLHSTMVLFKLTMLEMPRQEESIYIPLWSYSNKTKHRKLSMEYKFTFHYGPIQILFFPSLSSFLLHLHSTMVLFK